ncbi:single-stranded DNA-binding protein [Clostridium manihotivorum]|jgi:single-strand DNA-binding protein|uniref:Single-stranded DNA-binding protein n=1 Tax=Clostridium manihotivorum TaxID=2320868 RepID=A0A410DMV8_9CLOT|nr:single-stranded DNA-binding protein [Clostridium manihotivorum]QAA30422.1 single-stranded DNA-binding protein [Clostridium manihotivorum]
MNRVVLIGRLTKDPELRFTPGAGTAVTTLTLAVDKFNRQSGQREADFISVVVWGKQAESTANYMSKGSQMAISGRIQTRTYDAKDGSKRYVTEVVAEEVQFLGRGAGNSQAGNNNFGGGSEYGAPSNDPFGGMSFDEDMTPVDDGDIPF